jgi:hypothetical protein
MLNVRGHLTTAASGSRLNTLALTNLDGGFVVDSSGAHALLDLSSHGQEGLLDVACVLGRCLEEGDSDTVGEFLLWSALGRYDAVVQLTLATVYSTALLSVISLLLPTKSLLTPSVA